MTKEDKIVMRDWIDNFRLLIDSELQEANQLKMKVETLPPASGDYVMLFSYLFKKRVPLGLTDRRKTAKNLVDSRKN